MKSTSELLKELGWDDDLIQHYMIEDSDRSDAGDTELVAQVFDSRTLTVTFSAECAGSDYTVKG